MGEVISSYIFPHPPLMVPEVGKGNEKGIQKTLEAARRAAEKIYNEKPSTIIVTTPHAPVFQDYIYMSPYEKLEGDLGRFGAKQVRLEFENNLGLVNSIGAIAKEMDIFSGGLEDSLLRKYGFTKELDHGATVPLYFIKEKYDRFKLVHISTAWLPFLDLYKFGMCISKAIEASDERVVLLASGDLSHRLTSDGPYGFNEKGRVFDELLVESLRKSDVEGLLSMDEGLCEEAGECGLRSFLIMFGALDGLTLEPEVYSYEGPFGVGYSIARFGIGEKSRDREILNKMTEKNRDRVKAIRKEEDSFVALARNALEAYVNEGEVIKIPEDLPAEMLENRAGTFVSIKKHGQLRGCIGTTGPTRKNIAEEIIYNAISSGTRDPRFDAVEPAELEELVYSVDVLREPQPIESMDELDVVRFGVIVRAGPRSGLLLPNLEGVDTPHKQVAIALQKAGIREGEKYRMERFEVIRHK